jgi:hypothetical protein
MKKLLVLIGFLLICLVSNPVSASIIDVGSHVSTYTGKTRGFWFTAPADFIITGLGLPYCILTEFPNSGRWKLLTLIHYFFLVIMLDLIY